MTILLLLALFFFLSQHAIQNGHAQIEQIASSFVEANGKHFILNSERLYLNGFNAYWMMTTAAEPASRANVTEAIRSAAAVGMNVGRAWAFNDGDYMALQLSPGVYNEQVFKGLDFVVAEAGKYKVYLILSLVNNWDDYGGKERYVRWANITDPDKFYASPNVNQFFKNHVKTILTRKNTITGVEYRDDPTILAWELMNEPRCNDPSTKKIQNWAKEMAKYVKSIDKNHMVEIGLEGFYGESTPDRKKYNPSTAVTGSDFVSIIGINEIDFATIHVYPETWLPSPQNSSKYAQTAFADQWIEAHIQDCDTVLKKPLVIGEFGKSSKLKGFSLDERNLYFKRVYDAIYKSASHEEGSCAGGLFWQLMTQGTKTQGDGYEVVLEQNDSTASIIFQQSSKLHHLSHKPQYI